MRQRRKRASSKLWTILLLAILAIPAFYLGKRVYIYIDAMLEERHLNKEILVLKAENEVLKQRISEYKKGNLVETRAREDLGMIRRGEKIYLIGEK
jgi:cell division protein FtsB